MRNIWYPLKGYMEVGEEEMEGEVFGYHHPIIGLIKTYGASN